MQKPLSKVLGWPAFKNRRENPYNWLLYSALSTTERHVRFAEFSDSLMLREPWDIWHMHWPDALLREKSLSLVLCRIARLVTLVTAAKARGIRLVWTAHNLHAHERFYPKLEGFLFNWLTKRLDGVITLSAKHTPALKSMHSALVSKPIGTIPIGHFMGAYPNQVSKDKARERLGIRTDNVALFIGHIAPYKNVPRLLSEFATLRDSNTTLVVAGACRSDERAKIERAAAAVENLILRIGLIPEEEVQIFLNASDLVVLPHEGLSNSATAILALSFFRPALCPQAHAILELQSLFGEYVMTYTGGLTSTALAAALGSVRTRPRRDEDELQKRLEASLGWEKIAVQTANFYRLVLNT